MNQKHKHIIVFFCLTSTLLGYFFILLFPATAQDENLDFLKYEVNEAFVGILKHNIRITNSASNRVVGKLFVPLVMNETARHYAIVHNISSSTGQPTILSDDSENTYAVWNNVIIYGRQTFSVEINYYIFSFSTHYIIDSNQIVDYDKNSDLYNKYTQPEKLIQSDHPDIVLKAQSIVSGTNDIHEKVSKIYNFVITYLHYAAQNEERGALWALENRVGDCSEYSYLFVALCRAAGIPARIQAGFVFRNENEVLKDGHMWADYYLENYGWVPVDATWRLFDTMDFRHFSSIKSIPELTSYANYIFNGTSVLGLEDEQSLILQKCSPNVFGEASSLVENMYKAIQKVNQAKFTVFLAKIFGAALIFSSETARIEQTLKESQISLQKAVNFFETLPQFAELNATEAYKSADEALQTVWILIAEIFILLISTLIAIMIGALVYIRQRYKQSPLDLSQRKATAQTI